MCFFANAAKELHICGRYLPATVVLVQRSMPRPAVDAAFDVDMRNKAYAWAAYWLQRRIAQTNAAYSPKVHQ